MNRVLLTLLVSLVAYSGAVAEVVVSKGDTVHLWLPDGEGPWLRFSQKIRDSHLFLDMQNAAKCRTVTYFLKMRDSPEWHCRAERGDYAQHLTARAGRPAGVEPRVRVYFGPGRDRLVFLAFLGR